MSPALAYVALLRAVNLAGKNIVGMAGLRELCDGLGFEETRTLLQSGNLVIRAKTVASARLERRLEDEVKKRLGVDTDIFVRTAKEWNTAVERNPFPTQAKRDPGHLLVMFLKDAPDNKQAAALDEAIIGRETARVDGRHVYIFYPDGVGRSKLTTARIEKSLGTRGTARNWNTVTKLASMLTMLVVGIYRLVAAALVLSLVCGCARTKAPAFDVGRHRVRLTVPRGWEHVDHGRQHLFRRGVNQITLADVGPGSADGMLREIRQARAIWLAGRPEDAFERVRQLRSPELHFATSAAWTGFWHAWNEAAGHGDGADSSEIGAAFDSLVWQTLSLPSPSRHDVVLYALQTTRDMRRREIAAITDRTSNGSAWTVAETWDRVSHSNRKRNAVILDRGDLLVLWTEQGPIEQTGPAFDALLASIRVEK